MIPKEQFSLTVPKYFPQSCILSKFTCSSMGFNSKRVDPQGSPSKIPQSSPSKIPQSNHRLSLVPSDCPLGQSGVLQTAPLGQSGSLQTAPLGQSGSLQTAPLGQSGGLQTALLGQSVMSGSGCFCSPHFSSCIEF